MAEDASSPTDISPEELRIHKFRPPPLAARERCHTWAGSLLSPISLGVRTKINKSSGMLREIMYINPPSTVNDFYDFRAILGKGGFGVVSEILHAKTFQAFAGKVQKKSTLKTPEDESSFRSIMEILLNMPKSKDHIVTLLHIFEDDLNYYTVMQKCVSTLSWLVDPVKRAKTPDAPYRLTAERIQDFCRQILHGLCFLHRHRILHRDIKPENIMIEDVYESTEENFGGKHLGIKILDFDMCAMLPPDSDVLVTDYFSGTACFMAPEIFKDTTYSQASDIFSLGGTMSFLVTEKLPCPGISLSPDFSTVDLHKMMCTWALATDASMVSEINAVGSSRAWTRIPPEGIAALRNALATDRDCRCPSAESMLESDWLRNDEDSSKCPSLECASPVSCPGAKPRKKRRQRLGTATFGDDETSDAPQPLSPKYSFHDLLLQGDETNI